MGREGEGGREGGRGGGGKGKRREGGTLAGMRSSTPDEALPDSNGDSNDNGVGTISDPTSGISSGVVTLGPGGSEPLNESDLSSTGQGSLDAFANMTVDFGFWQPFSLGNRVWGQQQQRANGKRHPARREPHRHRTTAPHTDESSGHRETE